MKTKPILDDSRPGTPQRAEERTMNFFGLFSGRRGRPSVGASAESRPLLQRRNATTQGLTPLED